MSNIRNLFLFSSAVFFVSAITGCLCAIFAVSLSWVTEFRDQHLYIILGLPLLGMLMIWAYSQLLPSSISQGINIILLFLKNKAPNVPWLMAPTILISTLVSHLFGASVGREGTAVQMGGGVSALFMKTFPFTLQEKKTLLKCGVAAGFSALFGTPLAAAIFAFECSTRGQVSLKGGFWVLLSSFLSFAFYEFWLLPHAHYHMEKVPLLDASLSFWSFLVGLCCALAFFIFHKTGNAFKTFFQKLNVNQYLAIAIISVLVISSSWLMNDYSFLGLGIPKIQASFIEAAGFEVFLLKLLFTTACLSVGFKGGEVTPLFFIGATLGSALSQFVPLPVSTLAALGFMSVFSAAAKTPIACIFMGVELFGNDILLPISISCLTAFFFSGNHGIYAAQDQNDSLWS